MFELPWDKLLLLAPFIFFAGFVDAIAGGGGIIAIPAFLASGLNPTLVLGTNKLSSAMGTIVSTTKYYRRVRMQWKRFAPVIIAALVGSALGAKLVIHIHPQFIKLLMVVVTPIVAFLVYRGKRFGAEDHSHTLKVSQMLRRCLVIALVIGFYDGFFGPGTGTFLALAFTRFARFDLLKATAYAKYINLSSNLAALVTFLFHGSVAVPLGLCLGLFGIAGHYIGAHLALKNGVRVIRPVIVCVLFGLLVKIVYDW